MEKSKPKTDFDDVEDPGFVIANGGPSTARDWVDYNRALRAWRLSHSWYSQTRWARDYARRKLGLLSLTNPYYFEYLDTLLLASLNTASFELLRRAASSIRFQPSHPDPDVNAARLNYARESAERTGEVLHCDLMERGRIALAEYPGRAFDVPYLGAPLNLKLSIDRPPPPDEIAPPIPGSEFDFNFDDPVDLDEVRHGHR